MTTSSGGFGKAIAKAFTGEVIFSNTYTAMNGPGMIALGSNGTGEILAIDVLPGQDLILQKGAYLASTPGVSFSAFMNKKVTVGIAGGEGFLMQRISGQGKLFVEIDGSVINYTLQPGQQLIIDTGYTAMFDATCKMDIRTVPGVKNAFLGGEGFFNTVLTGPGRVWLQTNKRYIPTAD